MEQEAIALEHSPYFIREADSGVFYVVSSVAIDVRRIHFNYQNESYLQQGQDIKEIPTRGIELMIRDINMNKALQELRKFAQITESDYFSYESYGDAIYEYSNRIGVVKPRIFRKIII